MEEQSEIIFYEKQRFALWVYLLLFATITFSLAIMISAMKKEFALQNPPDNYKFLSHYILSIGIPVVITVFFTLIKLETKVKKDCLYVRLFPLNFHFKRYSPIEISECFARKYNPLIEYGGWGIRYSIRFGKAYNARGNEGVQLVFINGKKLLIGSQKAQELEQAVQSIMR